jgi:sugar lactone lactonase YvrE
MNPKTTPHTALTQRFVWGGFLVALAAALVWAAWPRSKPAELGKSFRYDIASLKQVDPARMIGREAGRIPAQVDSPSALAVNTSNQLYVGGATEIAVMEPDGRLLRRLPVGEPVTCLAAGREGELVVGHRSRIVVLAADGSTRTAWDLPGSNAVLTSVGVAGEDVFAADAGQRLVWRFNREGKRLGQIGARDKARDLPGFVIPSPYFDLALGSGGDLWVVDPGRHQLIQFSPAGEPMSAWARDGMDIEGFSGCCNPSHIAIRADGSFVTSEKGLVRIKIHAPTGALLGVLAGPDRFGEDTHGIDLAVDGNGRVLALDPNKAEILIFEVEGGG